MMKAPYFSIIIPTYNRCELLERTLDALDMQLFASFEVIVVDDGGRDNTGAMILSRKDPRIHYHHISNRERGAARNYGASAARGTYITFLDSDDLPHPDMLENARETIDEHNAPPFICLGYRIAATDMRTIYKMNELRDDDTSVLVSGNALSCICNFLRSDIAKNYRFNEDRELSGSEDWELWLRVVANHGFRYNPEISASLINHETRSVIHTDPEKLFRRKELALKYSFADPAVKKVYGRAGRKIEAFADSYISLHLALAGHRILSLKYLLRSVFQYPLILFNRRPLVILKRLMIGT